MTDTFVAHCEAVYKALADRATVKVPPGESETTEPVLVFTGAVSEVYATLGISQTYYGPIFKALEDVGSILRLQRGARGIDSVMVLRGLPDIWPDGLGWKGRNSEPLTEDSRYATILLDVQKLSESIGGMNVVMALTELESRIEALEKQERGNGKKQGNTK